MNAEILYPTIDEQRFDQLMAEKSSRPFLVVFTAEWVGEGTIMDTIIGQLSNDFQKLFAFHRIDVDVSGRVSRQLGIRHLPTIFFFQHGEIIGQTIGMKSRRQLQECIENMLQ